MLVKMMLSTALMTRNPCVALKKSEQPFSDAVAVSRAAASAAAGLDSQARLSDSETDRKTFRKAG